MGIETYPVIEGEEATTRHFLDAEWKWLTDCIDQLDDVVEARGFTPLAEFMSYSREDAIGTHGEEEVADREADAYLVEGWFQSDEGRLWSVERQWFRPEPALETTRALMELLQNTDEVDVDNDDREGLLEVLTALEGCLSQAQQNRKRFYLAMAA